MCSLPLLGAILGAIYLKGFWGALIGYFIGSWISSFLSSGKKSSDSSFGGESQNRGGYNRDEYRTDTAPSSRDEFLQSLLLLSAHIIQADGKIMHSEMECVRNFWRQSFGEVAVDSADRQLLSIFEQRKQMTDEEWLHELRTACSRLNQILPSEARSQLIAFLCQIAKADKHLDPTEISELKRLARYLNFTEEIIDQLLNLGGKTLEEAYRVLGVSPDATDDEVKRAYRKMALQYHPDKVAHLGDDVRAAAEKKFKEIGAAKEMIWQARGL